MTCPTCGVRIKAVSAFWHWCSNCKQVHRSKEVHTPDPLAQTELILQLLETTMKEDSQ